MSSQFFSSEKSFVTDLILMHRDSFPLKHESDIVQLALTVLGETRIHYVNIEYLIEELTKRCIDSNASDLVKKTI